MGGEPLRIVHVADLHLGMENYGRLDPATGLSSRVSDFLAALDEVVDYALNAEVDVVLFCGDVYKSRDPSTTQQREFAKRIGRLARQGVQVVLVAGNHDTPNALGRATSVEIFDTLAIQNVHVAGKPALIGLQTKHGPLQVVAVPWLPRSALLSREEAKDKTLEELNNLMAEAIGRVVQSHASGLDPSVPAVLGAHLSIAGAVPGSERSIMVGQDYVVLKSVIADRAFDYVALGHIHKYQMLSNMPPVVYAGSLQRIDFGEEEDPKGFVVVEIRRGESGRRETEFSFESVHSRRFLTVRVDADSDDPTETVLQAIARQNVADAVVRLQIKISSQREGLLQEHEIRRALKDAYYVAAISKEVQREYRRRLGGRSIEELSPLDALSLYFLDKQTSADRTAVLLEYGRRIISG